MGEDEILQQPTLPHPFICLTHLIEWTHYKQMKTREMLKGVEERTIKPRPSVMKAGWEL
jgi:hypothetical protein